MSDFCLFDHNRVTEWNWVELSGRLSKLICLCLCSFSQTRTMATVWSDMSCLVKEPAASSSSTRITATCMPPAAWIVRKSLFIYSEPQLWTSARVKSWSRRQSSPSNFTTSMIMSPRSVKRSTLPPCQSAPTSVRPCRLPATTCTQTLTRLFSEESCGCVF